MTSLRTFCFLAVGLLCSCTTSVIKEDKPNVVDQTRLRTIDVGDNQKIIVLDTCEASVRNILLNLSAKKFQLFRCSCYCPRYIGGTRIPSLHAYAAAIDINPEQNPYFNASTHAMVPAVIGTPEYGDLYLNRNIVREGMVAQKEADIFAKNGFTIWGGMWQIPIDYMHFQTTRTIAKILVTLPSNEASIFWNYYLKNPELIAKDEFFSGDIDPNNIRLDLLLARMKRIISCRGNAKSRM